MGKHGVFGFSVREMQIIYWRTHGIKTSGIARELGLSVRHTSDLMWRIMRKVGVNDVALLTRWAIDNAMDEPLPPETKETLPLPQAKVRKPRVRLWRIYRSGFGRGSSNR